MSADGRTDLFARAQILTDTGSLVTTLTLPHQSLGVYGLNYTPTVEGYFTIVYQLYFDALFTIPAGYENAAETLDVSSFRTNILRTLGLAHQNSVVDLQTYDVDSNLTSARIRCYDTQANATAANAISPGAYNTGLLFQYAVNASYGGAMLLKYTITKVL
jgi:hypothetical protein